MGVCLGKAPVGKTEEEAEEENTNKRMLFAKARKFLVPMPDGAATINETNIDAVRAEIERREALPPLVLTIQDLNGSDEETVARWDRIGASLCKALYMYRDVSRVLFGGIELTLTDRWEEGAEDIEDGVSAPRSVCVAERPI
jgi:hypothetical protein